MKRRRFQAAFTLVEVLVALLVFAVVSALSYTGLAHALETKDRLDRERAFWSQMSLAFVRMEQDFSEARPRTARDGDGSAMPAFRLRSATGRTEIDFTRASTPGLAGHGLERVGYRLSSGTLWRLTWPSIDRSPGVQPAESALLTDVESFDMRAHGQNDVVVAAWPADKNLEDLPRGVEMTVSLKGKGAFTRAFVVHE